MALAAGQAVSLGFVVLLIVSGLFGTQNPLSARYSSLSSAASASSASSALCLASKASEMYFRKISPSATCL